MKGEITIIINFKNLKLDNSIAVERLRKELQKLNRQRIKEWKKRGWLKN